MSRFCRIGAARRIGELEQPRRRGATRPLDRDDAGRRRERRQRGAVGEVARDPAALDQHRIARGAGEGKRRDDEEADLAVHLPVVEEDRALAEPAAAENDATEVLRLGGPRRRARARRRRAAARPHARLEARLERVLLRRAIELPEAEPRGEQRSRPAPRAARRRHASAGHAQRIRCSDARSLIKSLLASRRRPAPIIRSR